MGILDEKSPVRVPFVPLPSRSPSGELAAITEEHRLRRERMSRSLLTAAPEQKTLPAPIVQQKKPQVRPVPAEMQVHGAASEDDSDPEIPPFERRIDRIGPQDIIDAVCERTGVRKSSVFGKESSRYATRTFCLICLIARHYYTEETYVIAKHMGGLHYSLVADAIRLAGVMIQTLEDAAYDVAFLEHQLGLVPWGTMPKRMEPILSTASNGTERLTLAKIFHTTHIEFGISKKDLIGPRRAHEYVHARHAACLLAKRHTKRSLPEIGRALGGRDHTTALHSIRKAAQMIIDDPSFAEKIARIERELGLA